MIWVVLAVVAVMPAFGKSIYFADLNDATSFGLLGGTISDTGSLWLRAMLGPHYGYGFPRGP